MGLLVDGKWQTDWYDTESTGGRFVRQPTQFRDRITNDGSSRFPAEPDRYHLYVSLACPWAHRTLIFRKLKGLEEVIGLSIVDPYMADDGWVFSDYPGSIPDTVNGFEYLRQVYTAAKSDITTRVTVPILWDKKEGTIVNNESSEIIRIFDSAFDEWGNADVEFCPEELLPEIDRINEEVYDNVNNGVYRCGFATTQEAYEEAFDALFGTLDRLEERLDRQRYLVGSRLTEADWRLFTTLIRFDTVYHGHFKTNLRRIADYPSLSNYTRELYQISGVAETVNFRHIKEHYYRSHTTINPTQVVPKGPELELDSEHDRERLKAA